MELFNEKRSELEEQQLHLNVGLQKIRETVEQVEELQKSLAHKSRELEAKNQAANAKLKEMVSAAGFPYRAHSSIHSSATWGLALLKPELTRIKEAVCNFYSHLLCHSMVIEPIGTNSSGENATQILYRCFFEADKIFRG